MKHFSFILTTLLICTSLVKSNAQSDSIKTEGNDLVRWISFEEAQLQNKKFPKAIFIFVHTDWCGWCKHMTATTFSNPAIAGYINLNFYPVRFNAETKDTIIFLDSTFNNTGSVERSAHNLAKMLLNNKLTYPTTVFYNDNYQFKLIVPGAQKVNDIEPLLVYTTEYVFKTTAVERFRECYQMANPSDSLFSSRDSVHWMGLKEATAALEKQPKKMMVLINTKWCNSGRVMKNATFRDSLVIQLAEKLFYPVYLDAETKDTLIFKGQKFVNDGSLGTFHALAASLCNGRLVLPTMVFIDTNFDLISAVPQFYPPEDIEYILRYFGEDYYKTQSWDAFKASYAAEKE